jgi:hypothetical protein
LQPLSDVWRDISKYIKIYNSKDFENVPESPGVYAWFYPLTIATDNIEDLGIELSAILNYDSKADHYLGYPFDHTLYEKTKYSLVAETHYENKN